MKYQTSFELHWVTEALNYSTFTIGLKLPLAALEYLQVEQLFAARSVLLLTILSPLDNVSNRYF